MIFYLSLYGFLWSFGIQYKVDKSSYSSLIRIFIYWWHECHLISQNELVFLITIFLVIDYQSSLKLKVIFNYIPILVTYCVWYRISHDSRDALFMINLWRWITSILDIYMHVFAAISDTSKSKSNSCACLIEVMTVPMCLRLSRLQIGYLLYL